MRFPLLTIPLFALAPSLGAAEEPGWNNLEAGLIGSSVTLEGPAATGYDESNSGKRETGAGVFLRGRAAVGSWAHFTGDVSYEQIDGDVTMIRAHLAPGVHWHPGGGFALFAEAGVAATKVSGLADYANRQPSAVGDGGSDVGIHTALGVRQRVLERLEWHTLFGYQSYGGENYPATAGGGGASGDGPIAEIGAALDVGDSWALTAG